MQRRSGSKSTETRQPRGGGTPDGWYRIAPDPPASGSSNNARPVTPPSTSASSSQRGRNGPDSLGLVKAVDPMRLLLRETRAKDKLMLGVTAHKANSCATVVPSVSFASRESHHAARSSPRHLKLVQNQANLVSSAAVTSPAKSLFAVAEAFSPQRSLRLSSLSRRWPSVDDKKPSEPIDSTSGPPIRDPVSSPAHHSVNLPLHELIQRVDDAVDADPFADSNQTAVTQLFMAQWLAQFDASRHQFKSIGKAIYLSYPLSYFTIELIFTSLTSLLIMRYNIVIICSCACGSGFPRALPPDRQPAIAQ